MSEWKLFDGDTPHVSTFEFHEHRERAPHWEQMHHRPRLETALDLVRRYWQPGRVVVDLGCGDGGLVRQISDRGAIVYGYDFQPSNGDGWVERGIGGITFALDFVAHWDAVHSADIYVITECLEHLRDPHAMVRAIHERLPPGGYIIASSPRFEHFESHDECHAWAWDMEGYAALLVNAGFAVSSHQGIDQFQVIAGVK